MDGYTPTISPTSAAAQSATVAASTCWSDRDGTARNPTASTRSPGRHRSSVRLIPHPAIRPRRPRQRHEDPGRLLSTTAPGVLETAATGTGAGDRLRQTYPDRCHFHVSPVR